MKFISTNGHSPAVSFFEAVAQGLASDGGLFVPAQIPKLSAAMLSSFGQCSLQEIGVAMAAPFLEGDCTIEQIRNIVEDSITFDVPLVRLDDRLYSLELFHGPSCAFKDFGARFLAQVFRHVPRKDCRPLTIIVATSGDTGGAVAQGFFRIPGIQVVVLFPRGKVTELQERQFTTLGENITALEIDGVFDDCQRLVKQAFCDAELAKTLVLSSANSINIARLIPQMFYYAFAASRLPDAIISVPSGNFGNLTAGVLAKHMGIPITSLLAATNVNDTVPEFLRTRVFQPRPSRATISNAMDVGNPSNFARLQFLDGIKEGVFDRDLVGMSYSDEETRAAMRELSRKYSYVADPHGAVAYCGLRDVRKNDQSHAGVFLETAHPAKFCEIVREVLEISVPIPSALSQNLEKEKKSKALLASFDALKDFLLTDSRFRSL